MISLKKAINIIQDQVKPLSKHMINTIQSKGHIIAQDIKSDIDWPMFDRSTMDGYGINSKCYKKNREYPVAGEILPGVPVKKRLDNQVQRIMTGAVVPPNYDAVIPVEYSKEKHNKVRFTLTNVKQGLNIAYKGKDCKKDRKILHQNDIINISAVPALLSAGKEKIRVYKRPDVCIIITGDELIKVNQKPKAGQVRNINLHSLWSLCSLYNINIKQVLTLKDNKKRIQQKIKVCLNKCDLLLISGGVSMGQYDFVRDILKEDYKCLFHKVAQKPGKPVLLAKDKQKNKYLLGLPGNPVSVFISFYTIVLPLIRRLSGFDNISLPVFQGILTKAYFRDDNRTHLVPCMIDYIQSGFMIKPKPFHTSGDVISFINMDGFFYAEMNKEQYKKGDKVSFSFFNHNEM